MKRRLIALGAFVYAIFVPFEVLGGQFAESAAWAMRSSGRRTDDAVEDESLTQSRS